MDSWIIYVVYSRTCNSSIYSVEIHWGLVVDTILENAFL